jgi:hypothetical protein
MKQKTKNRKRKHTTATKKRITKDVIQLRTLDKGTPWVANEEEKVRWVHRDGRKIEMT